MFTVKLFLEFPAVKAFSCFSLVSILLPFSLVSILLLLFELALELLPLFSPEVRQTVAYTSLKISQVCFEDKRMYHRDPFSLQFLYGI
jgi:hypothetical protein